ncbi:MAG TPA: lysophospholipase [Oceanobacillus sp.]|nr:lysophospholipase [Oceanobacillus sp.]
MYHELNYFMSSDGLKIMTEHWLPKEYKAIVVVVHGYGEHSGRYRHVIRALTDAGYAVFTLDHRGHGQSEGLRAYFDSFDQPVNDLRDYINNIREDHDEERLFILGHSMGALITLAYTLRYPEGLAGIIVSAPPVNADANVSPALVRLGNILTKIIPKQPFVKLVPLETLSRDPDVIRAFEKDPLTYKGNMRVRMGTALNDTAKWVRERLEELKLPMLVLYGEDDKLVNPSGSQLLYEKAASADKTLKSYPELRHEILNEPEREIVIADIIAWLDARAEKQASEEESA